MPAARRGSDTSLAATLASQVVVLPANNILPLQRYYQSAELLVRQAEIYRVMGSEHQQYVMLLRLASLIIETLPRHKDYSASDRQYQKFRNMLLKQYFPEMEKLKVLLNSRGQATGREAGQLLFAHQRAPGTVQVNLSNLPQIDWDMTTAPAAGPRSAGGMDLLSSDGVRSPGQPGNLLPFEMMTSSRYGNISQEALSRHAVLPVAEQRRPQQEQQRFAAALPLYPDFDRSPLPPIDYGAARAARAQQAGSLMDEYPATAPAPAPEPPQQLTNDLQQQVSTDVKPQLELQLGPQEIGVTNLPSSLNAVGGPGGAASCCAPAPTTTAVPPNPLDKEFQGIRDVHVSVALMEEFMRYAVSNTSRNIETIGLLGGSLSPDGSSFSINTLIIPKQKGETDRVEMLAEEEIWDIFFQDGAAAAQSLFPVGWIHTHPAFDCFLSSVDMHNQYGYQVMLEEAVAVVMSPRDSRNRKCGIFRLSTPGGMQTIRDCSLTGFHTHQPTSTGQKIYELCGHVFLNPRVKHTVIDLRTG